MAVMHSVSNFDAGHGRLLLTMARRSIEHGLTRGEPLRVEVEDQPAALQQPGACFVTLHKEGQLRGCIGNLNPVQPLVCDVSENAYSAAFRDPRFVRVQNGEMAALQIEISILTPRETVSVDSEAELLQSLRPGIDGLVLEEGVLRATFLPAVWEHLPDPRRFLQQLKLKAGLPKDYWSSTLRIHRYRTVSVED